MQHNKCAYWVPRASANIGCNHTGVVGEGSEGLNDNLLEILQKEKVNINIVGDFKLNEEIAIISRFQMETLKVRIIISNISAIVT